MTNQIGFLFLAIAFVWVLQLTLSLWQTKVFYRKYNEMRKGSSASAIGLAGGNWKRKVYGVLVVDEDRNILRAEKLEGFTVFARLKGVPELVGLPLERVEESEPVAGVHAKAWKAFQKAADYIRAHDNKNKEEEE